MPPTRRFPAALVDQGSQLGRVLINPTYWSQLGECPLGLESDGRGQTFQPYLGVAG
jgi:hypothetical protein